MNAMVSRRAKPPGTAFTPEILNMAKTNYSFEKRRKELERKSKKEKKKQAKLLERTAEPGDQAAPAPSEE